MHLTRQTLPSGTHSSLREATVSYASAPTAGYLAYPCFTRYYSPVLSVISRRNIDCNDVAALLDEDATCSLRPAKEQL